MQIIELSIWHYWSAIHTFTSWMDAGSDERFAYNRALQLVILWRRLENDSPEYVYVRVLWSGAGLSSTPVQGFCTIAPS